MSQDNDSWKASLFEEKSLWDVYWKARSLGDTTTNNIMKWTIFLGVVVFTILNEWFFDHKLLSAAAMRQIVRSWSTDGVSFASQVLGFLIAGFTVFSTLTKPSLFKKLARSEYKKTHISNLKFIFFNLMLVFIHYLSFLSICLGIRLFLGESGPLTAILSKFLTNYERPKSLIVDVGFVVIGTWFAIILILLKSFIWNVYQSVLVCLLIDDEH